MTPKTHEITAVVDSAKFFGLPLGITVLMIFIMLVDGYDLQTMSFVAPVLISEWGVDRSVISYYVLSASMVGMAIGSIGLGWLGDRIGRKKSYIVCIAFLFVGSLLSAYSSNVVEIVTWRLVTGIGLGGVTPLCATLVSEWTPRHARSVAVACAVVAVPLGGMLGAMVAQWVIPEYGWRMIFFIGAALPLFFFVVAWFLLPESPRFLAQHPQRKPELVSLLNRLFGEKRFDGTETFTVAEIEKPPGNWFSILLKPPFLGTTLLLWCAFLFNTLALYAFVNLMPTVLTSTGISLDSALEGSKLFNFGGFFGAVGGAVLIGVIGSRLVGAALSTVGAIATALIGMVLVAHSGAIAGTQLLFLIWVAGMALNGMQCFLYTVGAHSYPTYIRASGVGCAQTVSRVGGVLSSVVGGAYFTIQPPPPVSVFFYVVAAAILIVVVSYYSMRTHIQGKRSAAAGVPAQALQKGPAP
jgi:AAHS family 4-hydroxybenzoate transporter-like MFS transporter